MFEGAVHDVSNRLEAAMGMPWRALSLAGRILDLAKLIKEEEGIGHRELVAGEGPADDEALALELLMGSYDANDRPKVRLSVRNHREAGKGEGVGSHCWHLDLLWDNCICNYFSNAGKNEQRTGRPSEVGC
jgi:hypothetical protein